MSVIWELRFIFTIIILSMLFFVYLFPSQKLSRCMDAKLLYIWPRANFPLEFGLTNQSPQFPPPICTLLEKCNLNFRDITWNEEENEILHEIFRVVSRFPTTFPVDYLCNSVEVHVALHHHLGLCTNCTCTACKKPVYCLKYNLNFGVSLHIL